MGGEGDMVSVLSLDDYEFLTGLRSASAATRKFGQDQIAQNRIIEQASQRALSRMAPALGMVAMSLADADKSGGLEGQVRQLTMIAPAIGSAFGPIGTGIGMIVSTVGSALIPKFFEAEKAIKAMGERIQENAALWDKFATKANSGEIFERSIARMDSTTDPKQVLAMKQAAEDQAAGMRAELEQRQKQQRQQLEQELAAQAKADQASGNFTNEQLIARQKEIQGDQGLSDAQYLAKHKDTAVYGAAGGEAGVNAIVEAKKKIDDLTDSITRADNRAALLGEKLEETNAYAAQLEDEKQLLEMEKEREALAKKIGDEVAKPYKKALEKQKELDNARARDIIDDATYAAASAKNLKELGAAQKSEIPNQTNAAVRAGAGREYEAVRASIKSSQSADTPETRQLRALVEIARKELANSNQMAAAARENNGPPLRIPGS